jgi:pilus assembly protein CpaB
MKWLKSKSVWLAVLALVCGLAASFAAKRYIGDELALEKARINPRQTMVDVVVAKSDLRAGDMLGSQNMAVRKVPAEFVSSVAVRPSKFDAYEGAKLANPLRAGEALLQSSVVGVDVATFSARVKPGVRAITIAVDEINSISGMLQPGDRVDLLFSTKNPLVGSGGAQQLKADITIPFMHNVTVLATGKQLRAGDDGKSQRQFSTITIEAETDQAQRLVVAQRSGKLTALLRNPEDRAPLTGRAMDLETLLQIKREVVAPAAPVGPQIIIGGTRQQDVPTQVKARAIEELARDTLSAPAASTATSSATNTPVTPVAMGGESRK